MTFSLGYSNKPLEIVPIGYEWNSFGGIEGDSAKRLHTGMDDYCILYRTTLPGEFTPHWHTVKESGMVMQGSLSYATPEETFHLSEGDTFEIPANTWHSFKIARNTVILLKYFPPFEGGQWGAVMSDQ